MIIQKPSDAAKIAMSIEKNGQAFYRALADNNVFAGNMELAEMLAGVKGPLDGIA